MSFDTNQVQATLGLRYGNIRKIGAGGMASVFSAYDAVLKRSVAVKLVTDSQNARELAIRFQREAKLASKLKHHNIVTVLDFGVGENDTLYLIMDLIEGTSLDTQLAEAGPMKADIAIPIFIQVCDALAHSHNQGVIHRDLKPSNIMIASDQDKHTDVRIVDFGIAKVLTSDQKITATGATLGTPLYSSPEQIQSTDVSASSDIYSFGCVMLAILTGEPPFRGETALATYDMHMNKVAPTLLERGFSDEHATELSEIIAKTLEKDPKNRYGSFDELKADLLELLSEESRAIVAEVEKKYAKERFASSSFMIQHKLPILIFGLIGIGLLPFALLRDQTKSIESKPEEIVHYEDINRENWQFFSREKDGLTTWTNIDCRMSDKHFKQLEGKDVRAVKLYAMRLNGSGLNFLKRDSLERLSVAESKIIDEYLHYIGEFKNLADLDLSYTWITDSGLATIDVLPKLKVLGLAGCNKLSDNSIYTVLNFAPNLVELKISLSPYVNKLSELDKFKKLKRLDISLLDLTDQTIEPVFKLKNLELIKIAKNKKLTDVTLDKLAKLPHLAMLRIESCPGFTEKAIERFKKAKPKCQLISKPKKKKEPKLYLWQTH